MAEYDPRDDWEYLGGTSRRYRNYWTGEEISRRKYDEQYGLLTRQGFKTYETKRDARATSKYKGFYQEKYRTLAEVGRRLKRLGHARAFVSAHGPQGRYYADQPKGWRSTEAFFADEQDSLWILDYLENYLETDKIDGWVLRWRP